MKEKYPSFQFYPGDWMKDPDLRRCSKAAKGMWIDMLCLAFECEERGKFISSGKPWSDGDISVAVGGDAAENLQSLRELLTKGVARRDNRGAIFSERMVRDERKRVENQENGKKGGNPLVKGGVKGGVNPMPNPPPNPNPTPSSSSSSSSSRDKENYKDKDCGADAPPSSVGISLPKEKPKEETPQVKLCQAFKETYEAMTGQPCDLQGKHYVIAARLIKSHGYDKTVEKFRILGEFCRDRTAWFTKGSWADFSLEKLSSHWNEIIPEAKPDKDAEMLAAIREQEARDARTRDSIQRPGQALNLKRIVRAVRSTESIGN